MQLINTAGIVDVIGPLEPVAKGWFEKIVLDLTDDYTYDNACHLEMEACELHSKTPEETLKVKHEGLCLPGNALISY